MMHPGYMGSQLPMYSAYGGMQPGMGGMTMQLPGQSIVSHG